jgi:hypothetical protein
MKPAKQNSRRIVPSLAINRWLGNASLAQGWGLDVKKNLVAAEVFFLTSFLIERNQVFARRTSGE